MPPKESPLADRDERDAIDWASSKEGAVDYRRLEGGEGEEAMTDKMLDRLLDEIGFRPDDTVAREMLKDEIWFCWRVEKGEVRSRRTYARFIGRIERATGKPWSWIKGRIEEMSDE